MRKLMSVLLVALGMFAFSCGDSDGGSSPEADSGTSAPAESPEPSPEPTEEASDPAPDNIVSATGFRFNTSEITLVAGEKTQLPFVNNDTAPHNISIHVSKGGKKLFNGAVVDGGDKITYRVPSLKKGKFYFLCDIHPTMEGSVLVQ